MLRLPPGNTPPLIRVHYADQQDWERYVQQLNAPFPLVEDAEDETDYSTITALVRVIDDPAYQAATVEDILTAARNDPSHGYPYLLLADDATLASDEHPTLAVYVGEYEPFGMTFRITTEQLGMFAVNLDLANMDFASWHDAVDADGVFRDFPDYDEAPPAAPSPTEPAHPTRYREPLDAWHTTMNQATPDDEETHGQRN